MKSVLIFVFSVLIGFSAVIVCLYPISTQNNKTSNLPTIKTKFSLENAPGESLKGNIASFSGMVNWQSRTATIPAQLKGLQPVQQGEEINTGKDGQVTIQIPNATSFSLLSNSDINLIQTLPADIVISQNQGIVDYARLGTIPVSIHTLDLLVQIDNGESVIAADKAKQIITVLVEKGSITAAYNNSQNISTLVPVQEGKKFIFHNDTKVGLTVFQ